MILVNAAWLVIAHLLHFFLMYIEKQATHLQVSLWFFFMKPQES